MHGKNAVEVILSEELSRKHLVFPVSLVKHFKPREGSNLPPAIVPIEPDPVKEKGKFRRILRDKKERVQGKDIRLYLVRYKGESADKDEWLPENNVPDGPINLRNYTASKRH